MATKLRGPRVELTIIILLNGHCNKLPSNYVYIRRTWLISGREASFCSQCKFESLHRLNGTPLSHCLQGSGSIAKKQAEKTLRGKDWGGVLSFGYDVVIKLMNSKGLWLSLPDQAGQTCNTGWGETHEVPPPYWGTTTTIGSAWLLAERDSFFFGSGRTVATGGLSMLHWIAPHPCPSTWAVLIGLSWCCTGQMDR